MNETLLLPELEAILAGNQPLDLRLQACLETIARSFGARSATLHRADHEAKTLHMTASMGIPEHLKQVTSLIPFGKGMAGICILREAPVTVCNLQTDESGVAKPAAKETQVAGAIVVPIRKDPGGPVLGTLGIGKPEEHDYTVEETDLLLACGQRLAGTF